MMGKAGGALRRPSPVCPKGGTSSLPPPEDLSKT